MLGLGLGLGKSFVISTPTPAWTPTDLLNKILWLKSNDESTLTHVSGALSQWNDKSGNNKNFTQTTGAFKPTTGTRTINGKNVIDFSGYTQCMTAASSSILSPFPNKTIFGVFQVDAIQPTAINRILCERNGTGPLIGVRATNEIAAFCEGQSGTMFRSYSADNVINTSNAFIATWQIGSNGTSTNTKLFINGVQTGYSLQNNGTDPLLNGDVNTCLGNSYPGAPTGAEFNGAVAEIIGTSGAPTIADQNLLGQYLANEWGLTWNTIS